MEYRWKVKITTDHGATLFGEYKCNFDNSTDVAKDLLAGGNNTFHAIKGVNDDGPSQLFFCVGNVAAMEISLM